MIIDKQTDKLIQSTISDENGAIDITDVDVVWRFFKDDEVVIEKTTTDGSITKTDATAGKIEFELDNTDTDITAGKYKYEVLIEDADSNRYLPLKGVLTINRN